MRDERACYSLSTIRVIKWLGRVVRSSTPPAVDSGSIPSRIKSMTLKLVFKAFLLDAQHYRDNVDNKPASLRVMPLGEVSA